MPSPSLRPLNKIVSGGQTGVDRAALDLALDIGMEAGGWCPRGRRAEDGRIPDRYPLQETPGSEYADRTRRNVRDSDGTLVLCRGITAGGTRLTIEEANRLGKPLLVVDLETFDSAVVMRWISDNRVATLNVAGPRESEEPGIYEEAVTGLRMILERR